MNTEKTLETLVHAASDLKALFSNSAEITPHCITYCGDNTQPTVQLSSGLRALAEAAGKPVYTRYYEGRHFPCETHFDYNGVRFIQISNSEQDAAL